MSTAISCASARLDDASEMAAFLSGIPNSAALAELLRRREPVISRAYDDDTWTARFVTSDGQFVKCFAVTDITIDQAEMIAAACEDVAALDEAQFRDVVAGSLGPTFEPAP
jgi:hypothetical protein